MSSICSNPKQRFVVEWRSQATKRWRIEHRFWTREAADAFRTSLEATGTSYQFRTREVTRGQHA